MPQVLFRVKRNNSRAVCSFKKKSRSFCIRRKYLEVLGRLPVILHFATKLFTAVPNFQRHWMRVPAAYKQTKNQINKTTHITAGSCYREVRWKWPVSTNGQKATISHFSAPSKLNNWPSPPWSCCTAIHREVHQEKIPINTSPRAAQSQEKSAPRKYSTFIYLFILFIYYSIS